VTDDEFDRMAEAGELLEWAEIYGHRSGTPARFVREARGAGRDVLLEIDVQGARWVRQREPNAVLVFLAPPSVEELRRRLRRRGTEDETVVARRFEKAAWEMEQASWFDHLVTNDDPDRAAAEVAAIIQGYRTPTEGRTHP
jgi:guanylate kinase